MKKIFASAATVAALTAAAVMYGCSGSGSGNGTLSASLTDSPACGYDHVFVTVASVGINSRTDGSGNWTDITLTTPQKIDLLSLSNGALEALGRTPLAAGTYQQLRLVLVPNVSGAATFNNSVVPSGQTAEVALKTPSAAQSGLKVNTRGPFTVQAGTLVDVVLDFNACKSIVTNGRSKGGSPGSASGYLLKPVITATTEIVSGTIDGYVDPADATTTSNMVTTPGATVYAEQNGVVVAGTVADATGHFVLSPLEQSSAVGNYDVAIVNAGKTTDVVQAVPVVAQATTSLSTTASPIALAVSTTGDVSGTVTAAGQPTDADVTAAQTLNGSIIETIALGMSDSTTGAYDFSLPVAAPQLTTYSTTLPLVFAAATSGAAQYTIAASTGTGSPASAPATVTAGATTTVDLAP